MMMHNILLLGDSIVQGADQSRGPGGFRPHLWQRLGAMRGDIDFVGPLRWYPSSGQTSGYHGANNVAALQRWSHGGFGGFTPEEISARWESVVLADTTPDPTCIVVMIGTDAIARGVTFQELRGHVAVLFDRVDASFPVAMVLVCAPPLFYAGDLVKDPKPWNAMGSAFAAWLASVAVTRGARYSFLDPWVGTGPADQMADGIHPNETGYAAAGWAIAEALEALFGPPAGAPSLREFAEIAPATSYLTEGGFAQLNDASAFSPRKEDFAVTFWFAPDDVRDESSGFLAICGDAGGWAIQKCGAGINLCWQSMAPVNEAPAPHGGQTNDRVFRAGRWSHVALIGNREAGLLAIYVDAKPIFVVDVPPWSLDERMLLRLAADAAPSAQGHYQRIRAYRGTSVPRVETISCVAALERAMFAGAALCADGSAHYVCDDADSGHMADSFPMGPSFDQKGGRGDYLAGPWNVDF